MHHITIDVEEFFHSTLLVERVPADQWGAFPRRAAAVTPWILDQFAAAGSRATFFVLGWTAERDPELVRTIHAAGHEIAAHSWIHRRVDAIPPEVFRDAVRRSKATLEDLTGEAVLGYRAPSFSISPGCEWAFDILLEEGYRYDSSLFPIDVGPGYGYAGRPRDPHWIDCAAGRLAEIPPLTFRLGSRNYPAAGGGYLRLLPHALITGALGQAEGRGQPGTLYLHPWDLDPEIRVPGHLPLLLRTRLHAGVHRARKGFARLTRRYPSRPIRETLFEMEASA